MCCILLQGGKKTSFNLATVRKGDDFTTFILLNIEKTQEP